MKRMKRSEQVLLIIAVAVGLFYFFSERVYDPMNVKYKEDLKQHNTLVADVNRLAAEPSGTAAVEKSIAVLNPEIRKLRDELDTLRREKLLPEARLDEAVVQIDSMAIANGLTVGRLLPAPAEELPAALQGEIKRLGLHAYRLELSGSYLDLLNFIGEAGKLGYLLAFAGLRIAGANDAGLVTAQLTLLL